MTQTEAHVHDTLNMLISHGFVAFSKALEKVGRKIWERTEHATAK